MKGIRKQCHSCCIGGEMHGNRCDVVRKTEEVSEGSAASDSHEERGERQLQQVERQHQAREALETPQ
eukprot:4682889-Prorocentrum_lima.AAC.1